MTFLQCSICICFCQSTKNLVHCAPDKHCMERPRRLTRHAALFVTLHPCLDLHPHNYVPSLYQAFLANASHRASNAYRITADVPLLMNALRIILHIRSANPNPHVRLACPKSNNKKRPSHTSFPLPICKLCGKSSVKKTGRSCASYSLYIHLSCHKPTQNLK